MYIFSLDIFPKHQSDIPNLQLRVSIWINRHLILVLKWELLICAHPTPTILSCIIAQAENLKVILDSSQSSNV